MGFIVKKLSLHQSASNSMFDLSWYKSTICEKEREVDLKVKRIQQMPKRSQCGTYDTDVNAQRHSIFCRAPVEWIKFNPCAFFLLVLVWTSWLYLCWTHIFLTYWKGYCSLPHRGLGGTEQYDGRYHFFSFVLFDVFHELDEAWFRAISRRKTRLKRIYNVLVNWAVYELKADAFFKYSRRMFSREIRW